MERSNRTQRLPALLGVLIALVLVMPLLAACAKPPTKLTFMWAETSPPQMDYMAGAIKEYKDKTGTDIELVRVATGDIFTKLQASIASGKPYDLATVGWVSDVAVFAGEGTLEPLDELIDKAGRDDFGPMSILPLNGQIYWYPYDYNVISLFYRKDLFQEKGLKPPATWDEWLAVSKALNEPEKGRNALVLPMSYGGAGNTFGVMAFYGNGGRYLDENFNVILDSPEMKPKAIEAINFYKELNQYMAPGMDQAQYAEALGLYSSGRVAMTAYAGRLIFDMEANSPELIEKTGMIPFPSNGGKYPFTYAPVDGFVVPKGPNSAAARDFLKWFVESKLIGFQLTLATHLTPPQKSTWEKPEWRNDPRVTKYWDFIIKPQLDVIRAGNFIGVDYEGSTKTLDPRPGKVFASNVLVDMFQRAWLKGEDPSKVVDEMAAKIREIIKK